MKCTVLIHAVYYSSLKLYVKNLIEISAQLDWLIVAYFLDHSVSFVVLQW